MVNAEPPAAANNDVCGSTDGFVAAVDTAKAADHVVLALGESREMSGEAAARSTLDLPGYQQQLIDAIKATGKPFAVVLFNGRPLTPGAVAQASPAILEAWFPGIQAGNAVADVLFGRVNPGGKLPVSFPQTLGQVPIYYNHEPTGRPCDVTQKYVSRYQDLPTCSPLYEFGYGLSYTTFSVMNLWLDRTSVSPNGKVRASVDVTNTGTRRGDEVVQLYVHDPVASVSQPVRRLRGFERVTLDPRAKRHHLHPRQEGLRLLRQPGCLRGGARRDRPLRGSQLGRHADDLVHDQLNLPGRRRAPAVAPCHSRSCARLSSHRLRR